MSTEKSTTFPQLFNRVIHILKVTICLWIGKADFDF